MAVRNDETTPGAERRFLGKLQLRDTGGDGQAGELDERKIGGYAARFNNVATIGGYFREQIAPGAFARAIQSDDVRALFNHDPNYVLGRTAAKTLSLREDAEGLVWDCAPPATSWAADLRVSIERGDISQCSFQFRAIKEEWDMSGDLPLRTLLDVDLYDVSAVTFPAYDDTTVGLRSLEAAGAIPPLGAGALARLTRKRGFLDRLTIRAE